jgi:hypothetical protein
MESEDRVALDAFPEDWKYYTLTFPVAQYARLSLEESIDEMTRCGQRFYSLRNIMGRIWGNLWRWRRPFVTLVANLSYRNNLKLDLKAYADFRREHDRRYDSRKARSTQVEQRNSLHSLDNGRTPALNCHRQPEPERALETLR